MSQYSLSLLFLLCFLIWLLSVFPLITSRKLPSECSRSSNITKVVHIPVPLEHIKSIHHGTRTKHIEIKKVYKTFRKRRGIMKRLAEKLTFLIFLSMSGVAEGRGVGLLLLLLPPLSTSCCSLLSWTVGVSKPSERASALTLLL